MYWTVALFSTDKSADFVVRNWCNKEFKADEVEIPSPFYYFLYPNRHMISAPLSFIFFPSGRRGGIKGAPALIRMELWCYCGERDNIRRLRRSIVILPLRKAVPFFLDARRLKPIFIFKLTFANGLLFHFGFAAANEKNMMDCSVSMTSLFLIWQCCFFPQLQKWNVIVWHCWKLPSFSRQWRSRVLCEETRPEAICWSLPRKLRGGFWWLFSIVT